jgi:hypothetical protein
MADFKKAIKNSSRINIDPEVASRELDKIKKKNLGRLRPKDIVDEARKESHPLHKCFEWDDSVAAEAYRVAQAQYLIRVIVLVEEVDDGKEPLIVRAYYNIKDASDQYYIGAAQALTDEDKRKKVLEQALKDLRIFREKYKAFKEFSALFAEMDKINL